MFIWICDVVNIIFNRFEYRIQKDKFISELNIETRAKLGEKYIDLELLKKPWYIRFKVWCEKKKKNYEEWRRERRQKMIEKEKAKLEMQEEKNKIDSDIAEFEQKELEELKESKKKQIQNKVNEEKSVNERFEENSKEIPEKLSKKRQAKITVKTNKKKK